MTKNIISKKCIAQLVAENLIRPTADKFDSANYDFYEIKGLNPAQIRLAVWKGARTASWDLTGYDNRDMWFALGNRPDLAAGFCFKSNSWRNDCGPVLMYGFPSPADWIKDIVQTQMLEQAQALGFESIAAMNEHQAWLDKQKQHAEKARMAVRRAQKTGSNTIDMR